VKSIELKLATAGIVAIVLAGCGGGPALTENERKYASWCTSNLEKLGQSGKQTLCECTARIVMPKLTQGEINSFANMVPELMGKALTDEMTRPHGFTVADNMSFFQKFGQAKPEVDRTCGT
jgi:hypothetical protein